MFYRYPGAQPFESSQQKIYYGRTSDSNNLYRLVKLEPLVVLYGKSGTGKSSLLNAALIPRATDDGYFAPLRVRFNAWQPGDENIQNPLVKTWKVLQQEAASGASSNFLDKILPYDASFWYEIKKFQFSRKGKNGILLIFDQFEELFTYPAEQILDFRKQLAEALFTQIPQRYWDALESREEKMNDILLPEELAIFQQPPDVKVLLAIRSDRMHLLHQINDYFPSILKNCYELSALDERQAAEAIELPAIQSGDFQSPTFVYKPDALSLIIHFLTDGQQQKIEATQLQIICNSIERRAIQDNLSEINKEHVADLGTVIENYYEEKITAIKDPAQQLAARRLVEEGLLFEEEERRLSLYEGQIYRVFNVEQESLRQLVDSHLLRAEPSLQGGYTYELSHDSLVAPVLKAKQKRLAEERRVAELQARAEREQELAVERKKRKQARLVALTMTVLACISLLTSYFAIRQFRVAQQNAEATQLALEQFVAEKHKKETLEIQRLLQNAETVSMADLQAALELLYKAREIDSTHVEVNNRINKLKQQQSIK